MPSYRCEAALARELLPVNKSLLRRCLNRVLHLIARISPGATTLRPMLHRARGVKVGRRVFIGDDVYIDGEYPEFVEIQDDAAISMRSTIIAHNKGPGHVVIEREAFVGPHVVVLTSDRKGVRIGEGAVVGAGSVISRNVPARAVVVAAPTMIAGYASVSLATTDSIEDFWAGLKPARTKARGNAAADADGQRPDVRTE